MTTGLLQRLVRAARNGRNAPEAKRCDEARITTGFGVIAGRQEINPGLTLMENILGQNFPRRAASATVPTPYLWDGRIQSRLQFAIPVGHLWDPQYLDLGFALPAFDAESVVVAEVRLTGLTHRPGYEYPGRVFSFEDADYGVDMQRPGRVVRLQAVDGGRGYTTDPTLTVVGTGTGATATAVRNATTQRITGAIITNPGQDYEDDSTFIEVTGGGGAGAQIRVWVDEHGGEDYLADPTLFWRQHLHGAPSLVVSPLRPGPDDDAAVRPMYDVAIVRLQLNGIVSGSFNSPADEVQKVNGYVRGSGWSYAADYWPVPCVATVPLHQAIAVDPITRLIVGRHWAPSPSTGSGVNIGFSGNDIDYPDYAATNPAWGIQGLGLVWPECRGGFFVESAEATDERDIKIFWKPAEDPSLVSAFDSGAPDDNWDGDISWCFSGKTLLETFDGSTPTGWNLLCTVPLSFDGFSGRWVATPGEVAFATQPTPGQLVMLASDRATYSDVFGTGVSGQIYPHSTRLPHAMRGVGGLVPAWDTLGIV